MGLKKPSKKTLHRRSRLFGVKSDRSIQNRINKKVKVERRSTTWIRKNKLTPREKFIREHSVEEITPGMFTHKEQVSTKLSLSQQNMLVVKGHGYVPKATKAKKTMLRIQPRNVMIEGWTCKERRLILLAQRKLQAAA